VAKDITDLEHSDHSGNWSTYVGGLPTIVNQLPKQAKQRVSENFSGRFYLQVNLLTICGAQNLVSVTGGHMSTTTGKMN